MLVNMGTPFFNFSIPYKIFGNSLKGPWTSLENVVSIQLLHAIFIKNYKAKNYYF